MRGPAVNNSCNAKHTPTNYVVDGRNESHKNCNWEMIKIIVWLPPCPQKYTWVNWLDNLPVKMKSMFLLVFIIWSKYASISRLRLGFICFVVVWESICCHKCLWRLASSVCGLARSHLPTFTCLRICISDQLQSASFWNEWRYFGTTAKQTESVTSVL